MLRSTSRVVVGERRSSDCPLSAGLHISICLLCPGKYAFLIVAHCTSTLHTGLCHAMPIKITEHAKITAA